MNVAPGAISTIWWFIAVWLAWKSIEWLIEPLFVRWTLTVSPRWTRRVGPAPGRRTSRLDDEALGDGDVLVDDREVDVMDGAREDLGRRGIEEGVLGRGRIGDRRRRRPAGDRAGVAAGAAPATMTSPFIPASAWPGIEHRKASPAAGTVTVPVALFPPSALIFVPSAKVTSWRVEPVFLNSTSYVPAAGTVGIAGVKPRSNASIEIFSACAGDDWGCRNGGLRSSAGGRRGGMRPATGPGPGRTPACGQGKGEAGEHRKTG